MVRNTWLGQALELVEITGLELNENPPMNEKQGVFWKEAEKEEQNYRKTTKRIV